MVFKEREDYNKYIGDVNVSSKGAIGHTSLRFQKKTPRFPIGFHQQERGALIWHWHRLLKMRQILRTRGLGKPHSGRRWMMALGQ